MYGEIAYTLFVFWVCGSLSVLVDIDHIWTILERVSPIRFSESYGRPFHTRIVFIVVACIICFSIITLGNGFYRGILQQFGEGGTVVFFLLLIILTYIFSKYLGEKFFKRIVRIRWTWRNQKEKPKNVR
jgi:hypothetical protein